MPHDISRHLNYSYDTSRNPKTCQYLTETPASPHLLRSLKMSQDISITHKPRQGIPTPADLSMKPQDMSSHANESQDMLECTHAHLQHRKASVSHKLSPLLSLVRVLLVVACTGAHTAPHKHTKRTRRLRLRSASVFVDVVAVFYVVYAIVGAVVDIGTSIFGSKLDVRIRFHHKTKSGIGYSERATHRTEITHENSFIE